MTESASERLLAFEFAGTLYALPIADVSEVADVPEIAAVPMLSREVGGVVNHHGDALPVVFGRALLNVEPEHPHEHLLVLATDPDDPHRYGLPVERIHGLIDGTGARSREAGSVVAERRPHGGRLMNVLDPKELLERAATVVEQSMTGDGRNQFEGGGIS